MQTETKEYTILPQRSMTFDFQELYQYRELFYFFTWRDIKIRYKQTALGIVWVILQPILTVLVFSLFFGKALKVPSSGLPYPVFVFSGLLLWNFFSSGLNSASNSMLNNSAIIKKIYFPRIIIPASSLLVSSVDFLITFVVFILMLIYYQVHLDISQAIVFWPLAILLMVFGTLGLGCWLSALSVKYRDFRYVVPFGLQILLFISPIIYPASVIDSPWINYILAINPMYGSIILFRIPMTGNDASFDLLLISSISTSFFVAFGIYYFRKTEAFFADIA